MTPRSRPRRLPGGPVAVALCALLLFAAQIRAAPIEPPVPGGDGLASMPGGADLAPVDAPVLEALAASGRADVVILLDDGVAADAPEGEMYAAVAAAQADVLGRLAPGDLELDYKPGLLPVLTGSVTARGLAVLRAHPRVVIVEHDELYEPLLTEAVENEAQRASQLAEAVSVVRADRVREIYGFTGDGVTVAVLDTGIDNDHQDFAGKIVDQHCYAASTRSCMPKDTVESDSAQAEHFHGVAVSGIILSNGTVSATGVAPGANLVALRVFRDSVTASNADIISGLDFAMRKQVVHDIRVVNMSLGGGGGRGVNCDNQNRAMKEAFQRLVARKVAIFVATGNNGYPDAVSSPACISNSIAVGATYDTEAPNGGRWCPSQTNVTPLTISCFTNRGRAMDLLAPGLFIASSNLGGGVTNPGAGTSYAAPVAAGVAALMIEADDSLRPSDILSIMQRTGRKVKHLENDDEFELVDALAAIEFILPATPLPSATLTPEPPTVTPTGLPATATPTATEVPPETATPTAIAEPTDTPPPEVHRVFLPAAEAH